MADSAVVTSPSFETDSADLDSAVATSPSFSTATADYESGVATSPSFTTNAASGLSISSVTTPFAPGDTVTIQGNDLDTVTEVTLGGEAQTIATQTSTEITFTAALGGVKYGTQPVAVTDGSASDSSNVAFEPVAGNGYKDVSGYPPPDGQYSVLDEASPSAEDGDQFEYELTTDQGANVAMNSDGTYEIDSTGTHEFQVRAWDASDSTWGAWATITAAQPDLQAQDIYTAAPTIDSPTLGTPGSLTAQDLVTGSPTIESATLGTPGALTAQDIVTGAPVIDQASAVPTAPESTPIRGRESQYRTQPVYIIDSRRPLVVYRVKVENDALATEEVT